ncbi:MAG: ABC transporter ATP-binding protein [Pseudomonadota bacterium]
MTVLSVTGLTKAFGGVVAASDVSFDVSAGELVAIIGPNGAGKSTTFNMVGGQLRPDRGDVRLQGESINGLAPRKIWKKGVGRTFQITATFPSMTVVENVQMALISAAGRLRALLPAARDLYRDNAMAALERVGMADQAERPCAVLAYGDIKRVELAIALASDPVLLLMDEPTAGMAPRERLGLMALTAEIASASNIAVLFTEHDMDVVFGHAARVLVLQRGEVIARGTPQEVRADPEVQRVYLGAGEAAA